MEDDMGSQVRCGNLRSGVKENAGFRNEPKLKSLDELQSKLLKGGLYGGLYRGLLWGVINGDTRSLDNGTDDLQKGFRT